jgi:arsenate reductase
VGKTRVLFVCVHNAARSQMAEAFLNTIAGDRFEAESAGLEPGSLNPAAVDVMREVGIDISANKTKSVFDFFKQERKYDFVVTVCDESSGERCPIFPGKTVRLHWSFDDPSSLTGTREDVLAGTRLVRDKIRDKVDTFIKETDR